jgi:hypothetical protein
MSADSMGQTTADSTVDSTAVQMAYSKVDQSEHKMAVRTADLMVGL